MSAPSSPTRVTAPNPKSERDPYHPRRAALLLGARTAPEEEVIVFSRYFWRATAERAVKSFAQSLLALLSAQQIGLLDVDWVATLSTAGMVTLLSVLTSLASTQVGDASDPSAVATQPAVPTPVGTARAAAAA
jgi:hypothetical protein